MERFISIFLIALLMCVTCCSCTGEDVIVIKPQNELSEFLADKEIRFFLDDGSIICYSSVGSGEIPGRSETVYYRYFPENNTFVIVDENAGIFSTSGAQIKINGNIYESAHFRGDIPKGFSVFNAGTDTFEVVGKDEDIYSHLYASENMVKDYDVNYTDGEKYYYIVDENDGKSYLRSYDKDGNIQISIGIPDNISDVREKYGSFTHMYVMDEYLYLGIINMSYSSLMKIKDDSLKVISDDTGTDIAIGYDPLSGENPVMYGKKIFSIFDRQTGKFSKSEIETGNGDGCFISAVWQNADSVLIQTSDEEGGNAYFIVPTDELPNVTLGDENTVFYGK